jgi:hypothetical protein
MKSRIRQLIAGQRMEHSAYIVECADSTYYTGITVHRG